MNWQLSDCQPIGKLPFFFERAFSPLVRVAISESQKLWRGLHTSISLQFQGRSTAFPVCRAAGRNAVVYRSSWSNSCVCAFLKLRDIFRLLMTAFVEVKGSYALSPFPRGTCGLLWTDLHPEGPAFKSLTAHHIQFVVKDGASRLRRIEFSHREDQRSPAREGRLSCRRT